MDYSNSAVNLSNPPEVEELLIQRQKVSRLQRKAQEALNSLPEYQNLQRLSGDIAEIDKQLKPLIDKYGSYQDTRKGLYAVKQARQSISYDPSKVKACIPQFADAVIEEVVNKGKIEGLLKGGLINRQQADACANTREINAYIIQS